MSQARPRGSTHCSEVSRDVPAARSIRGEQAEILEAVAMETSDIVGKPLKKITLPKGSLNQIDSYYFEAVE